MNRFNKYHFISDLKDSIGEFINDSEFEDDKTYQMMFGNSFTNK